MRDVNAPYMKKMNAYDACDQLKSYASFKEDYEKRHPDAKASDIENNAWKQWRVWKEREKWKQERENANIKSANDGYVNNVGFVGVIVQGSISTAPRFGKKVALNFKTKVAMPFWDEEKLKWDMKVRIFIVSLVGKKASMHERILKDGTTVFVRGCRIESSEEPFSEGTIYVVVGERGEFKIISVNSDAYAEK